MPKSKTRSRAAEKRRSEPKDSRFFRQVIPYNPKVAAEYESNLVEIQAVLMSDSVLSLIDNFAMDTLRASSIVGSASAAFAELFSQGLFTLSTPAKEMATWLNEAYLGTWDDPTFAVGALLNDLDLNESLPRDYRLQSFANLSSGRMLKEYKLKTGRTIVALADPMNRFDRAVFRFLFLLQNPF